MVSTSLTDLIAAFDEARTEHRAAAEQAEHWPYDHREADELAADTGEIATRIVEALKESGILTRGSTMLAPVTMTRDHADVLLDAAARLDERIASDNDEPWTSDSHALNPALQDEDTYIATLTAARAVLRSVVSGDADSVVVTD